MAKASELMRLDIMPSLDEIRNGKVGIILLVEEYCSTDQQNILEIDLVAKA